MDPVAPSRVVTGRTVSLVVPGSSANLGPGFDSLGLALELTDAVEVTALAPGAGVSIELSGPGSHLLPSGSGSGCENHLVVRALRTALHAAGVGDGDQPGLRLRACNGVPLGRGVGSSAAAIVAGVAAAAALLEEATSEADQLHVASAMEGHPDNAAASLLGGLTLGWSQPTAAPGSSCSPPLHGRADASERWHAVHLDPHPGVGALLCVPEIELSTARARAMLPLQVRHADAAHTAGRAALLVHALTRDPALLLPATEDRLHQEHRASALPDAWELLGSLRAAGHAAVVSGAGPSLLVLHGEAGAGSSGTVDRAVRADVEALAARHGGWRVLDPGIARRGVRVNVA